jgi:phosphoglycolate phosphatase
VIRLIIFDLDGTLADTLDDIGDAVNEMLTEYSYPLMTRNDILSNINRGPRELIRLCLPEHARNDELITEALGIYKGYYNRRYCIKTHLYEGVKEALYSLYGSGIKLAVLSNKQDEAVKLIISELLPDIPFSFVLGHGQFPTKPTPDAVNYIMDSLCVTPQETAFVGDSNIDMQTAVNSKTLPVAVTWGYRSREILAENGAKYFIENTNDLTDIPSLLP